MRTFAIVTALLSTLKIAFAYIAVSSPMNALDRGLSMATRSIADEPDESNLEKWMSTYSQQYSNKDGMHPMNDLLGRASLRLDRDGHWGLPTERRRESRYRIRRKIKKLFYTYIYLRFDDDWLDGGDFENMQEEIYEELQSRYEDIDFTNFLQ